MTELFVSYPDFKYLELDVYTKDAPESVTRALFADAPTSLGEVGIEEVVLIFGLPDEVRGSIPGDEEYGPMLALLIKNEGSHRRLDLSLARTSQDAHVRVKLLGDQTNILFDGDLPIQEVDDETGPHEIAWGDAD